MGVSRSCQRAHARFGARPMLDEQKAAARLQHAPDPNPTQFGYF
jgi:hypothetical protein